MARPLGPPGSGPGRGTSGRRPRVPPGPRGGGDQRRSSALEFGSDPRGLVGGAAFSLRGGLVRPRPATAEPSFPQTWAVGARAPRSRVLGARSLQRNAGAQVAVACWGVHAAPGRPPFRSAVLCPGLPGATLTRAGAPLRGSSCVCQTRRDGPGARWLCPGSGPRSWSCRRCSRQLVTRGLPGFAPRGHACEPEREGSPLSGARPRSWVNGGIIR